MKGTLFPTFVASGVGDLQDPGRQAGRLQRSCGYSILLWPAHVQSGTCMFTVQAASKPQDCGSRSKLNTWQRNPNLGPKMYICGPRECNLSGPSGLSCTKTSATDERGENMKRLKRRFRSNRDRIVKPVRVTLQNFWDRNISN